jgi:hypothetical protein
MYFFGFTRQATAICCLKSSAKKVKKMRSMQSQIKSSINERLFIKASNLFEKKPSETDSP